MLARFFLIVLLMSLGRVPAFAASAPTSYALGAHDELSVQVVGVDALSRNVTVFPDGTIDYPLAGVISVAGHDIDWLSAELRHRLEHYVRDPHVAVTLVHQAQFVVLVMGNVKQPGRYLLDRGSRITDAVAAAGGLGPTDGAFPDVNVTSDAGELHVVSLEKMLRAGQADLDLPLADRDNVYVVSPTTFTVEVAGSVEHPGQVEAREGERLVNAIARAGVGANSQADLSHVYVTHVPKPGQSSEPAHMVDVLHAFQHGTDDAYNPVLAKGDAIFVPKSRHGQNTDGVGLYYFLASLKLLI